MNRVRMMKVTFAGSGGVIVTKERACPCILIDDDIMIDCGSGSLKNLRQLNVDLGKIKKLLITHMHCDHISDLPPLLWAMEMESRTEPLEIVGYTGIEQTTKKILTLMNTPSEYTYFHMHFKALERNSQFEEIKTFLTIHKPANLAYKITRNGCSVCYSGDTVYFEPLAEFASNCNLLIHDSAFLARQKDIALLTNHSTAEEAGRIAKMANAKALALIHLFPYNVKTETQYIKQAKREFKRKIIVAKDMQKLII